LSVVPEKSQGKNQTRPSLDGVRKSPIRLSQRTPSLGEVPAWWLKEKKKKEALSQENPKKERKLSDT